MKRNAMQKNPLKIRQEESESIRKEAKKCARGARGRKGAQDGGKELQNKIIGKGWRGRETCDKTEA
jgi:hypothetical protein